MLDVACAVTEERVRRRIGVVHVAALPLEALEPLVDSTPARADEIDEKREIVDARMPLRQHVALEPFEPANRLVQEPADLGDMACDGEDLRAQAVPDGVSDVRGDGRLELRCGRRQCLDLTPRALESGLDLARLRAGARGLRDALLGPLECLRIHRGRGYPQLRMDISELDYDLPEELIAQHPVEPRDASRLLVYRRSSGSVEHRVFSELPELLAGALPVVNDSRVVPARLRLRRKSGGAVEVLLLELVGENVWEALARPSSRLRTGEVVGPVRLLARLGDGRWTVELEGGEPSGETPLPPYIREPLSDPGRYQTVYADLAGSAAAPTAGLHFTRDLVRRLDPARVTLHVGLDTFRPVSAARLEEHELHGERYEVAAGEWARIEAADRVLAVGTTTVRVLETIARTGELSGRTSLFVLPGFAFRRVDALLTNFHLPRSTLLALVMAFVGVDVTRELYATAVAERYRFYSFGDAMLVL